MNKKSVSSRFITELLVSKDMGAVVNESINGKFFTGTDKRAFEWITKHYNRHGAVPSVYAFKRKFPDYPLEKQGGEYYTQEPLLYWIDSIRELRKHNTMAEAIEKMTLALNDDDVEVAEKELKRANLKIMNELTKPEHLSIHDTEKRLEAYYKLKETGGLIGHSLGNEELDKMLHGAVGGTLTAFMGYTGLGKTWMLILIGEFLAMQLGLRVLFCTIETTKELIMRRFDAVHNKFDYSRFSTAQLTPKEEKKYLAYLDRVKDIEAEFIVESLVGQGVSAVNAKIIEHRPDVVLIDGAYLMADERGEEDNHMGILRVFNDLHKLCIDTNLPFFATTQSKDETGTTMKSLNFAKALATAVDNLMAMEQDLQMKHDKELRLKPLKLREGEVLKYALINWNFNIMNFDTIYEEDAVESVEETAVYLSR